MLFLNDASFEDPTESDIRNILERYKWPASSISAVLALLAIILKARQVARNLKRPAADSLPSTTPKKKRIEEETDKLSTQPTINQKSGNKVKESERECHRDTGNINMSRSNPTSASCVILDGCGLHISFYIQFFKQIRNIFNAKPISEIFDDTMIWAGSSSGGLLLLLLLMDIPIEEIEILFETKVLDLFKKGPTSQEMFIRTLSICVKPHYINFDTATIGQLAPEKKIILGVFNSQCSKPDCVTNYKPEHENIKITDVILMITAIPHVFFKALKKDQKLLDAAFIGCGNPGPILLQEMELLNIEIRALLHLSVIEEPLMAVKPESLSRTEDVVQMLFRLISYIGRERSQDVNIIIKHHFPYCSSYYFTLKTKLFRPKFSDASKQNIKKDINNFMDNNANKIQEFVDVYFNC